MNQYTIAREKGLKPGDPGWPKQKEKRRPMKEEVKEKIRETKARQVLEQLMADENTPPSVRVSAASKLLDKEEPTLSTVDATTRDETKLTEEQLWTKLEALIENNPELMSLLQSRIAKERGSGLSAVKESEAA